MIERTTFINKLIDSGFILVASGEKTQTFSKSSKHLYVLVSRDPLLDNEYIRSIFKKCDLEEVEDFISQYSK